MKVNNFSKEKRFFIAIFLLIIAVGVFLRTFHFQDNILFEIDQASDWQGTKLALDNGIGELPLLGARAGGTLFRIGPITDYFYYVSMLIFGDGLTVPSYPDLFFSILAIPLFYLFVREYFSKKTALVLMALFSVSLFAVEYSRFSWNPNSLPFFTLLLFYGVLRFSREVSTGKRIVFLSVASLALAILGQLHTIGLVAMPLILLGYWALGPFKIRLKEGLVALLVFIALVSPILVSEYSTGLKNSKAFVDAFVDRGGSGFGMDKKILKGTYELSRNYYLILTSRNDIGELERSNSSSNALVVIKKNINNKIDLVAAFVILILIVFSLYKIYREYGSTKGFDAKKNFLLLFLVWNVVYMALLVFLSEKQDSRHYLGIIFSPFILLGYHFEKLWEKRSNLKGLLVFIIVILLFINTFQCFKWLEMVEGYNRNGNGENEEYILEPYFKVTLSQYVRIADHIEKDYTRNKGDVEITASPYFQRSIKYILLYQRNVPTSEICNSCLNENKNYYLISESGHIDEVFARLPKKVEKNFRIESYETFGTLTVFTLKIQDDKLTEQKNDQ